MKEKHPYRRSARDTLLRLAAMICTVAMSMTAVGDDVRPTGFRPPPHRIKIKKADVSKGSAKRMKSTPLPSSWDSRDKGWVTSVKIQNPLGTCWTFAANAVIETQLLRTGRGTWDLSEKNMALLCGFEGDWNSGGNNDMAAAYLLRWSGAVLETNDVYFTINNNSSSVNSVKHEWEVTRPSVPLDPALHIQHVILVPELDKKVEIETRNALKSAIMEYGAVAVAARWTGTNKNGCSAYYNGSAGCDHAITVIGWDDNWSASNFAVTPPGDGAWLIKNSHGTSDGTAGGYWYVSYYDTRFGTYNSAVFIPATSEENYTAVYGYDKFGCIYDFVQEHVDKYPYYDPFDLMATVFTSGWNEELAAVGVYNLLSSSPYEISIYTNVTRNAETPTAGGVLVCQVTGTLSHAGFTTIPLPSPIPLADRTTFSVVYRQTGSERSNPLCCTCDYYCYPNLDLGQSYFGYSGTGGEGDAWIDGANRDIINKVDSTDVAWAACLKAYTRTTVPAKAGDAPGETADGTKALAATNALAYAQHGETFGAFANIVGANGRTLWANWLAGLDPANPNDDFTLSIAVTNGVPSLSWKPDLGAARTYTIWGCRDLSPANKWNVVAEKDLATTTNRFFKVTLSP